MSECAVLYSGGTDSTCVAALMAERHECVRLLTFEERGTAGSPVPTGNVERLRAHYGRERFTHALLDVDRLVSELGYRDYGRNLRRHGAFMLSNPGFSSLSWHARTIAYCLEHGIARVADGVTRELTHFPGHMDPVLALFKALYARFGIDYSNPVREWEVPPDVQFFEKLVVDPHQNDDPLARTTGRWLYEKGLMPAPNVKGTPADDAMQHGCYPFALFNVFAFWFYLPFHSYEQYERRMAALFADKCEEAAALLEEYRVRRGDSELGRWIGA